MRQTHIWHHMTHIICAISESMLLMSAASAGRFLRFFSWGNGDNSRKGKPGAWPLRLNYWVMINMIMVYPTNHIIKLGCWGLDMPWFAIWVAAYAPWSSGYNPWTINFQPPNAVLWEPHSPHGCSAVIITEVPGLEDVLTRLSYTQTRCWWPISVG